MEFPITPWPPGATAGTAVPALRPPTERLASGGRLVVITSAVHAPPRPGHGPWSRAARSRLMQEVAQRLAGARFPWAAPPPLSGASALGLVRRVAKEAVLATALARADGFIASY